MSLGRYGAKNAKVAPTRYLTDGGFKMAEVTKISYQEAVKKFGEEKLADIVNRGCARLLSRESRKTERDALKVEFANWVKERAAKKAGATK